MDGGKCTITHSGGHAAYYGDSARLHVGGNFFTFVINVDAGEVALSLNSNSGRTWLLKCESLIFIRPGESLTIERPWPSDYIVFSVNTEYFLERFWIFKDDLLKSPMIVDIRSARIGQFVRFIRKSIFYGDNSIDLYIDDFISCIGRSISSRKNFSLGSGKYLLSVGNIFEIFNSINKNVENEIYIELIARDIAKRSASHFSRAFLGMAGITPHQYVIATRLRHAKNLLINPAFSLSDVANESGFSSQSHMTRFFTKNYGAPPGKIRDVFLKDLIAVSLRENEDRL